VPDDGKVGLRAEVVSDGNRLVQVQDDVPVTAGHKDRLARMLNQFNLEQINLSMLKVNFNAQKTHLRGDTQCFGQS